MRRTQTELYEVMCEAIAYLRLHAKEHPTSRDVARELGMSVSRFEHAFAAWVGTTPKRFLAFLSKERAKALLRDARDVLSVARESGLTSPGRLHDLMVTYEALTPGEVKSGDFTITYGLHPSPFGWCLLGATSRGVAHLSFTEDSDPDEAERLIRERWPFARLAHDQEVTKPLVERIFGAARAGAPLHLLVKGTNFQVKVWEALLSIPEGRVVDYAAIAREVGAPKAVRAVGSACGKNGIAYLIPCHRVLASDGGMGGYRWGAPRKEAMLVREAFRDEA